MKQIIAILVLGTFTAAPLLADDANVFSNEMARVSYAIGMNFGGRARQQDIDLNDQWLLRGLQDAQSGKATLLTPQEMQETLRSFQQSLMAKMQKLQAEEAVTNKAKGDAFLAENKTKPGVQILPTTAPDGKTYDLQYKVITEGDGPTPTVADTVTVNYRGTLIDGTEFDSSAKAGHPVQFPLGRIIPGWREALTHMKVGAKWQLFIPAELAYGAMGRPPVIPPNSTLIFDVELLSIQPPSEPKAAANPPLTSDIIKVPSAEEMKKGAKIEVIKPEDAAKMKAGQ